MKKITIQEAFSLGVGTSFHLFIKKRALVDKVLKFLEEKEVLWNNSKRPTQLKEFMDRRMYPLVLTVNKRPDGYYMTYSDGVAEPFNIIESWGRYPSKGYVLMDAELTTFKIKRRDKL